MKEEELKNKLDFNNMGEREFSVFTDEVEKRDYFFDDKEKPIYPISPVEMKLIGRIKELEARITDMESQMQEVKR